MGQWYLILYFINNLRTIYKMWYKMKRLAWYNTTNVICDQGFKRTCEIAQSFTVWSQILWKLHKNDKVLLQYCRRYRIIREHISNVSAPLFDRYQLNQHGEEGMAKLLYPHEMVDISCDRIIKGAQATDTDGHLCLMQWETNASSLWFARKTPSNWYRISYYTPKDGHQTVLGL